MTLYPLAEMNRRIETDRLESDVTLFWSLVLKGELLTKLTVAGFVSLMPENNQRIRYQHLYQLVRADGIGMWAEILEKALNHPVVRFLPQNTRNIQKQLTQRVKPDTWEYEAIRLMEECLETVSSNSRGEVKGPIQIKQWFRNFATLRNSSRGHGAQRTAVFSKVCPGLEKSLAIMEQNLNLLNCPWAYIYQTLSGKFRITSWGSESALFQKLTERSGERPKDGVYLDVGELHLVDLVESDVDVSDIWLANGSYTGDRYELISYTTGNTKRSIPGQFSIPPEHLPDSETHGMGELLTINSTFTNVPPVPTGYVIRRDLEFELMEQLQERDHHPIVTLTGYGGIGKTSLTLRVVNGMMEDGNLPYDLAIWFSARDVDLLLRGPKPVRPQGLTAREFAHAYQKLLGAPDPGGNIENYLAEEMGKGGNEEFTKLFIFDNFETTSDPLELYRWIDTYIRPPNKVVITSRERRFRGDYTVTVHGMNDNESRKLIESTSQFLKLETTLTDSYISEVVDESRGHPYVIKLILGAMARDPSRRNVERIMAPQDEVLNALFERSYNRLSAASQRAFLTLCRWRSSVPRIALEAVLLRPENEIIQVDSAIDELSQMSFVEEIGSEGKEEEIELSVPLSARLFGRKKLETSSWRASVEADSLLLQLFGTTQQPNDPQSGERRVKELFRATARSISQGQRTFREIKPILEYVSRRFSVGWVLMADLIYEVGDESASGEVLECLIKYVEDPGSESYSTQEIWRRIFHIYSGNGNIYEALHALAQIARQPGIMIEEVSSTANEINRLFRDKDTSDLDPALKATLVKDVVGVMENKIDELKGDSFSRLAWLYLNIKDGANARRVAKLGLQEDPDNYHCQRLIERLDRTRRR